jgi:hypothetical protein
MRHSSNAGEGSENTGEQMNRLAYEAQSVTGGRLLGGLIDF